MRIISLFSGAGGLDLGLIQAGHEVVWANDFAPDAVETYRRNIGAHIVLGDIAEVDPASIPEGDVVVGGFPCQGFSQANYQRVRNDPRNRLYRHFLRIVEAKQPKYFLAENVKGLLCKDGGKVIGRIVADFRSLGYRVQFKLFNVADFGVPQMRQRVIIAGTSDRLPANLDYSYPKATHVNPSKQEGSCLRLWVTVAAALKGMPEPGQPSRLPNHVCSQYKITNRNFTGHRWTDPDKPSPTILARGNGKGGVCVLQHPSNLRRLTVREAAAIQTFPKNFEFVGSMTSCYRQIGNAVPVLFAKRLGTTLARLDRRLPVCV